MHRGAGLEPEAVSQREVFGAGELHVDVASVVRAPQFQAGVRPDRECLRQRGGANAIQDWAVDWEEFGRRVRRDILVLEKLLVDKGLIDKADLYGDPGDPPPPPDI